MNTISGSSVHFAGSSLRTHSVGMQVTAHNLANISTDGFTPQRATFTTGSEGYGVDLQSVRKVGGTSNGISGASGLELSGTDPAREFTHMINMQRGFEANAATVRTAEQMSGTIINMIA